MEKQGFILNMSSLILTYNHNQKTQANQNCKKNIADEVKKGFTLNM